jgi:hypothetical protein
MREDLITLSQREIERLRIIHKVMDRQVRQVKASELLGITDRQVRNIMVKIREKGDEAIAHGNRGRAAPNKMGAEVEDRIARIVKRRYQDFGPTLASEKLAEREGIHVGREKLRQIKEMRLEGVSSREEANRFLKKYLPFYNKRFSKVAREEGDFHKPLAEHINLREIFCIKGKRTINNGCIVKWRGRQFIVESPSIAWRGRKVEVMEHFDGEIAIKFNGRYLKSKEITVPKLAKTLKLEKPKSEPVKKKTKSILPPDHPWRRHIPSLHHNWYLERV